MIINAGEGHFLVTSENFDGDMPTGETSGAALLVDDDVLVVRTWAAWEDVAVSVMVVEGDPGPTPEEWQEARRTAWYVTAPPMVVDARFDPFDRPAPVPLASGVYGVDWRARTRAFAASRDQSWRDAVAEEHQIRQWRAPHGTDPERSDG